MYPYEIKIESTEENERLGTLYRVRVTDLSIAFIREIRLKYQTFSDLHDSIVNDNPYMNVEFIYE
jgi:hypothetical protein